MLKVKVLQEGLVHNEITRSVIKRIHHVGGDVHADPTLSLHRGCTNVGRAMEMLHLKKRVVGVNRLVFKHIQSGRGERARFKGLENSVFVDDTSPRTIDDVTATAGTVLPDVRHGGQAFGVDKMVRFLSQIAVNRDVSAVGEQGFEGFVEASAL